MKRLILVFLLLFPVFSYSATSTWTASKVGTNCTTFPSFPGEIIIIDTENCPSTQYTFHCGSRVVYGVTYVANYAIKTGSGSYASVTCYSGYTGPPYACPTGQTWVNPVPPSTVGGCQSLCVQPANPCDMYSGTDTAEVSKKTQCMLSLIWDAPTCDYKHAYGCGGGSGEDSGPFGGYYPSSSGRNLGDKVCAYGCEYLVDESVPTTNQVHVTLSGATCTGLPPLPNENYDDEVTGTDEVDYAPDNDKDSGTNCGEFNGEYICVESIPNGTCVSSPSGAMVCVSPPTVTPDVPVPVPPDFSIDTPGPNPAVPTDNDRIDYYVDIDQPECPSGFHYSKGKCVADPDDSGQCPNGSTLYNGVCVSNNDPGGPFGGAGGVNMGPGLDGPPDFSYLDTLNTFYNLVRNTPLLDFAPNCGSGSSSCPSMTILGTTTSIHCDLADAAVPMFSAFLWLVGGLVAIRAVFSA